MSTNQLPLWTIRDRQTGREVQVDPTRPRPPAPPAPPPQEIVPGELFAGGESGTFHFQGRLYREERVPIEDLVDWRLARGLHPLPRHRQPAGLRHRWPPVVMYEEGE